MKYLALPYLQTHVWNTKQNEFVTIKRIVYSYITNNIIMFIHIKTCYDTIYRSLEFCYM